MIKQTDKKRNAIIIAVIAISAIAGIWHLTTLATTDYGITSAYIDCDGDNYVFSGTFYTWRAIATHQVQVFCDDDPRYHILNFYEAIPPSSGTYDWSVTYDADDFNALMPCDRVSFQCVSFHPGEADSTEVFWKTRTRSLPDCGTSPTPTPTTTPSPSPSPTATPSPSPSPTATPDADDDGATPNNNPIIYGGVVVFMLLLYFAYKKER